MRAYRTQVGINDRLHPESWVDFAPPHILRPRFAVEMLNEKCAGLVVTSIRVGLQEQLMQTVPAELFTDLRHSDGVLLPTLAPGMPIKITFRGTLGALFWVYIGDRLAVAEALRAN